MVDIKQLYSELVSLGMPVAYHHFNQAPASLPYIVYYAEGYESTYADSVNYQNVIQLRIELYSDSKNFEKENAIEDLLTNLELPYAKDETWIDEEQIWMIIYELEVL